MNYSLTQKIACLERELRLRFRVYPRRVAGGLMSKELAQREVGILQEILDDYRNQRQEDIFGDEISRG